MVVERHALQRRIARLESLLKVPKEKRHVFAEQLNKAVDVELQGDQLGDRVTGKKSIWKSTLDPEEVVSVEELSLQHYRAAGWTGYAYTICPLGDSYALRTAYIQRIVS